MALAGYINVQWRNLAGHDEPDIHTDIVRNYRDLVIPE